MWRRLRLPRVRFFSPPVSRGQVSGPKMLTCTLGLGQHHVCKYLITPCILYKLYPWNGLYNPSYGTPCIQSLGCLLLQWQCVCKYQILGPPEVGGRGDTRAPPPATNPLIVGVSCCGAANLHTLPWPVSSNSGDIWHGAINLKLS